MKKRIIQISIAIIGLMSMIAYVFWKEGIVQLGSTLRNVDYRYIALAAGCAASSILADGASLHLVRLRFQKRASLASSMKCGLIATSLGYITPFQTGYVAGAITYLSSSQGMKPSEASVVTLVKLIYYTLAAIITHAVLFAMNFKMFDFQPIIWVLAVICMCLSALYMIFLMMVSKFAKPIAAIANALIRLAGKLRIVKNPDKASWKAKVEIHSLKRKLSAIHLSVGESLLLFLFCSLSFMSLYLISWFIYLGFHPSPRLDVNFVITGNALCQILQQLSPIPGGIGVVDTAFTQIMNSIFGDNLNVAMLLWRIVSLYLVILVGLLSLSITKRRGKMPQE